MSDEIKITWSLNKDEMYLSLNFYFFKKNWAIITIHTSCPVSAFDKGVGQEGLS